MQVNFTTPISLSPRIDTFVRSFPNFIHSFYSVLVRNSSVVNHGVPASETRPSKPLQRHRLSTQSSICQGFLILLLRLRSDPSHSLPRRRNRSRDRGVRQTGLLLQSQSHPLVLQLDLPLFHPHHSTRTDIICTDELIRELLCLFSCLSAPEVINMWFEFSCSFMIVFW